MTPIPVARITQDIKNNGSLVEVSTILPIELVQEQYPFFNGETTLEFEDEFAGDDEYEEKTKARVLGGIVECYALPNSYEDMALYRGLLWLIENIEKDAGAEANK